MGMPEQLEVVAHGATAMLATWLGLTVALRAPRSPGARAFGVLVVLLVTWSLSIIVRRLTLDPGVDEVARWFEVGGASLLPPAVLTVATALTVERRTPRWMALMLVVLWTISVTVAVLTIVAPELEPRVAPPHLSLAGVPGEVIGWGWIALRVIIFVAAIVWVAMAVTDAGLDRARRRQLEVTLLALVVGTIGGVLRITPPFSDSEPWIGVSLVAVSVVLAVYAIFAQGIFFAPEIAGARLPHRGAGRTGNHRLRGGAPGRRWPSSGRRWTSSCRSSSAWRWWRRWPSSSRSPPASGAGWAPVMRIGRTSECCEPSGRTCSRQGGPRTRSGRHSGGWHAVWV